MTAPGVYLVQGCSLGKINPLALKVRTETAENSCSMSKHYEPGPEEIAKSSEDREKQFSIQFEDPDFDFLFAEEEKAG